MIIRETIEPFIFSTDDACAVTGTSRATWWEYKRKGGGQLRDARAPRYLYRPVLQAVLIRALTATGMPIEATQSLTLRAGNVADAVLQTIPGVVQIEADPALGPDFVARERARLEDWAAESLKAGFLFKPSPMPDDTRPATIYERHVTDDLDELLDGTAFLGTLVDCEAVAHTFLTRVRRITDRPLEIRGYAPETSVRAA